MPAMATMVMLDASRAHETHQDACPPEVFGLSVVGLWMLIT